MYEIPGSIEYCAVRVLRMRTHTHRGHFICCKTLKLLGLSKDLPKCMRNQGVHYRITHSYIIMVSTVQDL